MTDRLTHAMRAEIFDMIADAANEASDTDPDPLAALGKSAENLRDEAARREAKQRVENQDEIDSLLEDETACRAAKDGECAWRECPQTRDGEPMKSGRHCPLDTPEAARRAAEAEAVFANVPPDMRLTQNDVERLLGGDAPPPPAPVVMPEYVAEARACAEANGPKLAMQAHIINLADAIEALRAERDVVSQSFEGVIKSLGCEPDDEAVQTAIEALQVRAEAAEAALAHAVANSKLEAEVTRLREALCRVAGEFGVILNLPSGGVGSSPEAIVNRVRMADKIVSAALAQGESK